MKRFNVTAVADAPVEAADLLVQCAGLPKGRIKDAMNKGAVWLSQPGRKRRRLRRATTALRPGDRLELYYDEALLAYRPPPARCLSDQRQYSVWCKPAGVLAQGTDYGDHAALLRQAEQHFQPPRPVFPVHRLDREAAGLMLVAHTRQAAAELSQLFRDNRVYKEYRVEVRGRLEPERGEIDRPLDGKPARSEYVLISYDPERDSSIATVLIHSGRLHQIRRHFELIGHPVLGDPKYGSGNKDARGLQLVATKLRFRCPIRGAECEYLWEGP